MSKKRSKKRKTGGEQKLLSPLAYAVISLIAFVIGTGLLLLFIFKADDLVAQGIDEKVFYVLLLPLGLSAAGFLFGVMHSYAAYKGKILGGVLRLGGPVVLFLIVVILGFTLVPETGPFDFTIFLRDADGKTVLKEEGVLKIILRTEQKIEKIDDKGSVDFKNIPAKFKNKEVVVEIVVSGWQFTDHKTTTYCNLASSSATLIIERDDSLCCVSGSVTDSHLNPVVGASIIVQGIEVETDKNGRFFVSIPPDKQQKEQSLSVIKEGYKVWEQFIYPGTKVEVKVVLQKLSYDE